MRFAPQLLPHVLQLRGSLVVFTQAAPHLVKLPQVKSQPVPVHTAVPPGGGEHTLPQVRQLVMSVFRFLHCVPHFEYGELQLKPQAPPLQNRVLFGGWAQGWLQPPQCATLVSVSTQEFGGEPHWV